ncbi:kynurenine formamidase isoform X4 [Alosa sapidissima]|uniref:kynurenine formamidase isoform X4 n=1 Tax=Alosa sapidissima TaxID=34773 RepID=UPI001C09612A|nr:kynurenine formamidase isoform X4 [Alosa sapidissima]
MLQWEIMDKDELERQYSPRQWSHRMSGDEVINAHVTSLKAGTETACNIAQTLLDVPYGQGEDEKLDVYMPCITSAECPLLIYFHGGYWQFLSKAESGFMAVPLVSRGVAVVAVDYSIAPKGNMDLMVSQVRKSVVSIIQQYSHIRCPSCGHGPLYRLVTVQYHSSDQREIALHNSPIQLLQQLKVSSATSEIVVAVAQNDSPEFRRQSEDYFNALKSLGMKVTFEDVPNTDHFNIMENFVDSDYYLTQLLLKMMGKD